MRKVGWMIAISLLVVSVNAFAKRPKISEIKRGEMVYITEGRGIRLVNVEPVTCYRNSDRPGLMYSGMCRYGDYHQIEEGDIAQVVGIAGNQVLLVGANKRENPARKDGFMFFVSRQEFLQMKANDARRQKKLRAEQAEKELVKKLVNAK
ncbi:MAG: hypothetical protein AAB731_02660 [Patescibacteria group bacterium]